MSRHPYSRYWKRVVAFVAIGFLTTVALYLAGAYLMAVTAFLVTLIATAIYLVGESSDLPGTAGDGDQDVPARLDPAWPAKGPTVSAQDRKDIDRAVGEGMGQATHEQGSLPSP
jgi:hypothetical protein